MKLIAWLTTVIALSVIAIFLSETGTANPVRNLSLTVTSPIQQGMRDVASPVNNIFGGLGGGGDLADENEDLKAQVEQLQAQLAGYEASQQRIAELEAAVGVKQGRPDDSLEAANVIAEDTSGLKRLVAIDKGERDGLDEGMVVLSRNGSLIGTVAELYSDFAWVRLITDPDSAVNAQIGAAREGEMPLTGTDQVATPAEPTPQAAATPSVAPTPSQSPQSSEIRAVARGDLRRSILLDLIPSGDAVSAGEIVVTSGHGGNYPRGLLLGTINDIEVRPQAPFKTATVRPSADLSGLGTVLVLTSFMPARLSSP